MLFFSILLIKAIFKSRSRINLNNTVRENKRLKKDIKFAISLLLMNLLFVILHLPFASVIFLTFYDNYDLFNIFYYIYYISYGINFYIIFFTNSLFRTVFFTILFRKTNMQENNRTHLGPNHLGGLSQMSIQITESNPKQSKRD